MLINCSDYSQYQSNGLCYNFCSSDAFAIVQGSDCWCSNYVPGATTSGDDCNVACPGYPDDLCGNQQAGLFGYISIPGNSPSGTKGGSTAAQSTTPLVSTLRPNMIIRAFLFHCYLHRRVTQFALSGIHLTCKCIGKGNGDGRS